MKKTSNGFTLVELLVVIGILGILMGALFPAISAAMLSANLSACSMRGRNLYVGITTANTEREAAGLSSVWPKSQKNMSDDNSDIAGNQYSGSVDYFKALFDLDNFGSDTWAPYVSGVDVGVLSGSGVPGFTGNSIKAENVSWVVAKGLTDEMEDIIPVLVTRNFPVTGLEVTSYDGQPSTDIIKFGSAGGAKFDTPFSNKAWVLVRKGGAAQSIKAKYSKKHIIYNRQSFTIPTEAEFSYLDVQ